MPTIQQLPGHPAAGDQVPLVTPHTHPAPLMGPANRTVTTPLMGPADLSAATPLMGLADAGHAPPWAYTLDNARSATGRKCHEYPPAAATVHRGDRAAESSGRRGRVEHPRPAQSLARIHRGLDLAQPRRVRHRARPDREVPGHQVGE